MLLFALVARVHDGVPLAASTDLSHHPLVSDAQKYVKIISKRASSFPDRCAVQGNGYHIYFITALNVCCVALCEGGFPYATAFAFLHDLQKEFITAYDPRKVTSIQRPYALIEFDMNIQKLKQKYNGRTTPKTMSNLVTMNEELALRPPHRVELDQLEAVFGNSGSTPNTTRPTVRPNRQFIPLNVPGYLAIVLNVVCAILNLTRGMSVGHDGHFDHTLESAYIYGGVFMAAAFLCLYQIYLLRQFIPWRRTQTFLVMACLLLCNFYTSDIRNHVQVVFHVMVTGYTTFFVLNRQLIGKLPEYSV
ncbi:vesicle-trafficking protein SEC22a-like [Lineus longissimus]|uniref:vesicle-trafficking protein SEC22a-like n=1 Tax=Lineus longissimus TaxID=88925 RepID=UPI002B4E76B2